MSFFKTENKNIYNIYSEVFKTYIFKIKTLICSICKMDYTQGEKTFRTINRRTENIMVKRKKTKGQTMIYKILHRKLMIEQHEVKAAAPEGFAVRITK